MVAGCLCCRHPLLTLRTGLAGERLSSKGRWRRRPMIAGSLCCRHPLLTLSTGRTGKRLSGKGRWRS
jgi:hypothetical protein